jgi:hypothetical protein
MDKKDKDERCVFDSSGIGQAPDPSVSIWGFLERLNYNLNLGEDSTVFSLANEHPFHCCDHVDLEIYIIS